MYTCRGGIVRRKMCFFHVFFRFAEMGKQTNTCPITGGARQRHARKHPAPVCTASNCWHTQRGVCPHDTRGRHLSLGRLETWVAYYCCVPSTLLQRRDEIRADFFQEAVHTGDENDGLVGELGPRRVFFLPHAPRLKSHASAHALQMSRTSRGWPTTVSAWSQV